MDYVDRKDELERLDSPVKKKQGGLIVIWGRRRIGKTRLLLEWSAQHNGIYTVADQSGPPLQRKYVTESIAGHFKGFDEVVYPDWRALLQRITTEAERASWRGPLIFDEFPYLVAANKTLPSVFQNWVDHEVKKANLLVAIAGSSQRMMQGLIGRASVAMEIGPLFPGYIKEALGLGSDSRAIESYAVWGGVPRYWELSEEFGDDLDQAIDRNVLDPRGPLHSEPERLLLEETPPAVSLRPLLDVIGAGAHKLSEIASRLEQPATSLSRPISRLVELGLVKREIPFGESVRSGKRALYRIADPFFRFWFRVVAPHRALLAEAPSSTRTSLWEKHKEYIFSEAWENLCRQCVPFLHTTDSALSALGPWEPARRYWRGKAPEWDVVAKSVDGKKLLLGEVKWSRERVASKALRNVVRDLIRKGVPDHRLYGEYEIVYAVFFPNHDSNFIEGAHIIDAGTVLSCLSQRS